MSPATTDSLPSKFFEPWEGAKADYFAAKNSRHLRRRMGLPASGAGADWHIRSESEYLRLMELGRDLVRNDVIIGPGIEKLLVNVLQEGFVLDPQTGDKAVDEYVAGRWLDWSTNPSQCDLAGELDFNAMEYQNLGSALVDGGIFNLPMASGALEMVEGHRCRTPRNTKLNVVHGVKLNPRTRKREQYWFTKESVEPGARVDRVSDMRKVEAYDENGDPLVFHVYDPKRVSQTRGVSLVAPIFPTASMHDDVQFAKMVQQQAVSSWALIIERTAQFRPGAGPGGSGAGLGEEPDPSDPLGNRMVKQLGPGMIFRPRAGEKVTGFSPNVPSQEFFQHVRMMLQMVGLHLKLPLVLLLMDASETNFSGWRGAVDQAKLEFRRIQRWFMRRFHKPVYEWKVRQWLAQDAAFRGVVRKADVNPLRHRWNVPRWSYIQPLQDAQAHHLRVSTRQTSPRRAAAELSFEYEELCDEIVTDNKTLILKALTAHQEILKEFPKANLDWHELLHVPVGEKLSGRLMEIDASEPTPGATNGKR